MQTGFVNIVANSRCDSEWKRIAPDFYEHIVTQQSYPRGLTSQVLCAGRQGVDACKVSNVLFSKNVLDHAVI